MNFFLVHHAGSAAVVRAADAEQAKLLVSRRVRDEFTVAYDRATERLHAAVRAKAEASGAFFGELLERAQQVCPDEWRAAQEAHALLGSATQPTREIGVKALSVEGETEIVVVLSPRAGAHIATPE